MAAPAFSFMGDGPGRKIPVNYWGVSESGDYLADSLRGQEYALEYLDYEEGSVGGPPLLPLIIAAMPRDLGPIEISFLTLVAAQARAGKGRARQIAKYWADCSIAAA